MEGVLLVINSYIKVLLFFLVFTIVQICIPIGNCMKVFSKDLPVSSDKVDTGSIVKYAEQFVGVRYSYGGASPRAFDCSGFTMYVMSNFGIYLPHSASCQSKYGTKVSSDELEPADLVFFATSWGRSITHVGMYVGDNFFIHSASRGVRINNLDESYYNRRYVTAVRLIQ